ncbi:uncharacterized protein BKCO1_100048 [Diplodia corticola]|uniref:AGC-kinase C-terminal domain-containing protein n=1 Tax=Diplodia corticola TaxID=236234 RepID=A0A1J9RGX8_9PEZI|nr:uncharacterized protein BKCO1_100048 [Diplodia corticola]OJD40814.1 hypothetical protein BKCO1_100048 [Diplodia corticola]
MAPSNVFSYLRPHHRRAHSQPNSPEPPVSASSQISPTTPQHFQDIFSPATNPQLPLPPLPPNPHRFLADQSSSASNSPVSPFPPVLPPIPRIASRSEPPAPQKQVPRNKRRSAPPPPASAAQKLGRQQQQQQPSRPFGGPGTAAHQGGSSAVAGTQQLLSPPPDQPRPSPDSVQAPDSWRDPATTSKRVSAPTGFRSRGQRAQSGAGQNGPLIDQVPSFSHSDPPAHAPTPSFQSPYMMSQSSLSSSGLSEKMASSGKPAASAQHGKSGKRGLNLLNPMSLLLRRRSAQALQHLSEESLVTHRSNVVPAMALGDDFDPSIRGHIVHDFSAPKPRRAVSYDPAANNSFRVRDFDLGRLSRRRDDESSPSKRDRSHTPVFKENFDDNTEADDERRKSAIRAETLANHDFLARNAVPSSEPELPAPPFARTAANAPHLARISIPPPLDQVPIRDDAPGGLATVPEASPTSPVSVESKRSSATKASPKTRSRATSGADSSFQPAGLPTHMTSRASRFSFQIAGVDSAAQEKLLEEKHRQKVAARERNRGADDGDEEEDDFDYDNIDDDLFPGFEEEVPTIGEDLEYPDDYGYGGYGGYSNVGTAPGLASYDINSMNVRVPFNSTLSPISAGGSSLATPPIDAFGNVIGSATADDQQKVAPTPSPLSAPPVIGNHEDSQGAAGLGLIEPEQVADELGQTHLSPSTSSTSAQQAAPTQPARVNILDDDDDDDDDMYFDDGMIGEPDPPEHDEKFDESVFDDPNHPLYERPAPVMKSPPLVNAGPDSDDLDPEDEHTSKTGLAPHPSMRGNGPPFQVAGDPLEFNNPKDYFSALVQATHKAEADGRFVRKNSVATTNLSAPSKDEDDEDEDEEQAQQTRNAMRDSQDTAPDLVPDSSRVSAATETFSPNAIHDIGDMGFDPNAYEDDFGDGFDDYDSALEDDPIIAAANAEALANDYEGEYGSEFGFYASAGGGIDAVYGGFFGPRDMIGRSVSGRYAVREPNLTPITERSEYSTRNSFIGMGPLSAGPTSAGIPGQHTSAGALPSPGLAQLARMSPYGFPPGSEDDHDYDYSFEQLMKLRKGAFGAAGGASPGGSAASSPRNSSPLSYFPGSFPGRSSPVATRAKSALDTYTDLPEVEETPNEPSEVHEGDEDDGGSDGDEAALLEVNRADSASDTTNPDSKRSSLQQEKGSATSPISSTEKKVPHQINTNYEYFLPDQPGNIPVSVPTSAISTTSTNSLPTSLTSAGGAHSTSASVSNIASAPLFSSNSSQPLQSNCSSMTEPRPSSSDQANNFPLGFHSNAAISRDSSQSIAVLSPLSPSFPAPSANFADHPHYKSGGGRHSRTSSGGMDSVAYIKERVETEGHGSDGRPPEFRWVLERRRTSGTGEVEVIGREIVEGGRI